MHKSTRTGLIGLVILVFVVVIVLLLNLESIKPSAPQPCVKLDGYETCHSSDPSPYRYYGTKTSYHIAIENQTDTDLPVEECTPVVFYLLSRHATRYPDKEYIEGMIKLLPTLKEKIINNTKDGKAAFCQEDLESLKKWKLNMKIEDDNRLSQSGKEEAEDLGHRYKEKFPLLLDEKYSPEKFTIEYTSRERTKVTAESFTRGLFGDDSKNIEGKVNDEVLTFHKSCKKLRKKCEDPSYDVSEIEKFKNGELMKKVVTSVSKRTGVTLTSDDITLIYTACVFGYALKDNDAWCSLLSTDDLEVLEFYADIDDYYKDAYGNKVNYEQACPVAKYIFNLFKSVENTNDTKVVLQFSHAGAMKKVYSLFGLNRDELPLTADAFCSERNRKWRSSYMIPFNSNIAFVLYQCGKEYKVGAFHNEKAVKINGCEQELCSFEKFSATYEPISNKCNVSEICCTCCSKS
ncbi:multiple inositol polyphosphate phosphatase 1 [Trichonephila clavipes]|nr:multiple inositol polyphosphate phosphatase 1 [Trichonephila clavipes]